MLIEFLINAFAMLFVTIDPIGLAPVFLAVTAGADSTERRQIAIKAVLISGGTLLAFFFAGRQLLNVLGISQAAFQVAGGLLLFIIAVEMVFEHRQKRKAESAEKAIEQEDLSQTAVFPLAIPLIAGPATISAIILLAGQAPSFASHIGLIAVLFSVLAISFLVFMLAARIDKLLGSTVQLIVTRLFGVILAALSVQFVADGIFSLMEMHS
ncbi:MarC family protein [Pseudovibrio sp. Tun.PSC04-5.I4]|uniref:MarC family protein n=1 Tax=Pseudovibrio sp. Tun.PSC04-5.I4 TaxID=1798213 RepID=UPI00088EA47A|nr:MarC family protein [Pseudovibrio sp. Tun.PSC04-5.I4]SDR04173.1 multiple antibiotic resistance protein [Pseudovibrio sp. Tun.PSC04-5.I4]